jgi:hypothetical protein
MEFAEILFGQSLPPTDPPWAPKVTSHAPGQILTVIVDYRQRSLAFMATRDAFVVPHCGLAAFPSDGFVAAGKLGERRLVMQAFYGELSKPARIGHSIRHKVQKLAPDGNSKLTIVGIVAEGVIRP